MSSREKAIIKTVIVTLIALGFIATGFYAPRLATLLVGVGFCLFILSFFIAATYSTFLIYEDEKERIDQRKKKIDKSV